MASLLLCLSSPVLGHVLGEPDLAGDQIKDQIKFGLWQRGEHAACGADGCSDDEGPLLSKWRETAHRPVLRFRGGADGCSSELARCEPEGYDLDALRAELGEEFSRAIEQNLADHDEDCDASCRHFYCGDDRARAAGGAAAHFSARSHPMGDVPPEDFAAAFRFPLDLIKVSSAPLIPPAEAEEVVAGAVDEGIADHEYTSGKYKLGGDWVKDLPRTLAWFNRRLEDTIFPAVAALFPEVVNSPGVLRAHSVAVLKHRPAGTFTEYNSSHPRTDVHVDDGILALTLALSPRANYTGGGTFYEHLGEDHILEMEQGYCTMRPGSVRHGGHRVVAGDRYILGAFLLISDRVEHVRRLNNQGRAARSAGDLRKARLLFKWALKLNPKCATCLKNWAEALSATPDGSVAAPRLLAAAEDKLRRALALLPRDSDALFSLGVLLSNQGRKDEALEAYMSSFSINADDHELCYNIGVQLGEKGRFGDEVSMYQKALEIKSDFGKAWANLGVALASSGRLEEAEPPFLNAVKHQPESRNNWINLAKMHQAKGRMGAAKEAMMKAQGLAAE